MEKRVDKKNKEHDTLRKRVVDAFVNEGFSIKESEQITFHMLDGLDDFKTLMSIFNNIEKETDEEICTAIRGFLIHVPNHINAAKCLYGLGPVEDIFGLGILSKKE